MFDSRQHLQNQNQKQKQKQTLESEDLTVEEEEKQQQEEEIEELERQVGQMAEKIRHFRRTVPNLLKDSLLSSLVAQRPLFPQIDASLALTTADRDPGENVEMSKQVLLENKDPETAAKICLLKSKISSNVSAMPIILKRMKECISEIDKLDRCNVEIHPAFKKKRTN